MSAPDCRCGEPSFDRCAYCRRAVCLDCADPHDAACAKSPANMVQSSIDGPRCRGDRAGFVVIPGAAVATEDAL